MACTSDTTTPVGRYVHAETRNDIDLSLLQFFDDASMLFRDEHRIFLQAHGIAAQRVRFFRRHLDDLPILYRCRQAILEPTGIAKTQAPTDHGEDAIGFTKTSYYS